MRHPLPGSAVAAVTAATAAVCWPGGGSRLTPALALAAAGLVCARRDVWRWRAPVVVLVVAAVAWARADGAWDGLRPRQLGPYEGWVEIVGDPRPAASATRVIVEVEGERFEYWARGRAKRMRVDTWRSGDRVLVHGAREALEGERRERVAWQHVVGELRLEWVADNAPGARLDVASNRVRTLLERGARVLAPDEAALYRGLVVGDDRDQSPAMLARFRASGLSHLTAVSGQNVAFLLAAAGPALRRLRPTPRWAVTLALIGWFVALTRFEPSILRAGAMGAISATAFALGRERAPARLLCLAVTGLLLLDPLLARSVGFWLSVGATAGVTTVGPWIGDRLRRPLGMLATPLGVTLGAQLGVAVPALVVFGRLPLVSIPANVLAVPVAGAVMLYGLPAGLVSGAVPVVAPLVMMPCRLGVRWVDLVARLGERVEPGGTATAAGWALLLGAVGVAASTGAGKNRAHDGRASADR